MCHDRKGGNVVSEQAERDTMELWFTEKQTEHFGITCRVRRTLAQERTPYQDLLVVDTCQWGPMLLLDGMVMTTEVDEFVYHEMVTHPALFTHPNPRHVLVVGGGDGGAIREVLKHPSVEKAILVEIDQRVVENSRRFLPTISSALDDPRVEVRFEDGFKFIHDHQDAFDVIMVDSTEPVGPAVQLFEKGFYEGIYRCLKEDGILVAQTDNPWFKGDLIRRVYADIAATFPITRLYWANVPTYPSGLWTFTMGSKKFDPLEVDTASLPDIPTRYYTPQLHKAAFVLPRFVQDLIRG